MLEYKEITSSRLKMRLPNKRDYIYQFNYQKDLKNYPWADLSPYKSMKDVDKFFKRMLNEIEFKESLFWVIADKVSDEVYGVLSFWNIDEEEKSGEFGYSLYPEARGFGYMEEAVQAAIDFCSNELGFRTFYAWTHEENNSSRKLLEKLEFTNTGTVRERAIYSKKIIPYVVYKLDI